jgi:hypothetical protein
MSKRCEDLAGALAAFAAAGSAPERDARAEREHAEAASHVAGCAACAAELASLRATIEALRSLPPPRERSAAEWSDFSRSVRIAYQDRREANRGLPRWLTRLLFGLGAAAAAGAAFAVVPRLSRPPAPLADTAATVDAGRRDDEAARARAARRMEAAGGLLDEADDLDTDDLDELVEGLDGLQLENVDHSLRPGA